MLKINCISNNKFINVVIIKDNNVILKDMVKPGIINYKLDNGIYKLYVSSNMIRIIPFYLYGNLEIKINLNNGNYVYLFDNNYDGLKIKKGEITLWQNM